MAHLLANCFQRANWPEDNPQLILSLFGIHKMIRFLKDTDLLLRCLNLIEIKEFIFLLACIPEYSSSCGEKGGAGVETHSADLCGYSCGSRLICLCIAVSLSLIEPDTHSGCLLRIY